ncbi:M20 aminoacylase family protein [Chelativorans sp. M5D2P16]|uniref:M20 aminoacylase family protein n=1 Tax=Chelativorans sp. M5D2P16 TaxID=3095678 RepID=UPI002ACA9BA1|nr:M20 aminoacylase family protein [Chelativorans sp. M5D2P16]MDZ5697421.1 M20 aminoacylase family protein [Chelativorans sp. M5D2P16]
MAIENWIARQLDDLTEFRRDLHRHPELLYEVDRTASRVADALRAAGVDEVVTGLGRTGVVGVIRGNTDTKGRMIGLRADMDALPIEEASGAPWASTTAGRMHACGHDGHTTMLLGAARQLAESRAFDGTVVVIFQPAEEGGAGAKAMIEDGLLKRFPLDEIYGLHNKPNLPLGQFAIASGPVMGSVDEIRIRVEGVGGHAAFPHQTVDPLTVTASLIQAVQTIVSRNIDPLKSAVVSITTIHGGDAFNVIPQSVMLTGTVRTLDPAVRDEVEQRLSKAVAGIAAAFDAKAHLDYIRSYPVTINDAEKTTLAAAAAAEVAGQANVQTDLAPVMGGEDFAFMLEEVPGAMIFAGHGPSAGLHHPEYDFNDELIPWGCSYWTTLVRQRLSA